MASVSRTRLVAGIVLAAITLALAASWFAGSSTLGPEDGDGAVERTQTNPRDTPDDARLRRPPPTHTNEDAEDTATRSQPGSVNPDDALLANVDIRGELPPALVASAVRTALPRLRRCIEDNGPLLEPETAKGEPRAGEPPRFRFELRSDADRVTMLSPAIEGARAGGPWLEACLQDVSEEFRTPGGGAMGQATIWVPLDTRPEAPSPPPQ